MPVCLTSIILPVVYMLILCLFYNPRYISLLANERSTSLCKHQAGHTGVYPQRPPILEVNYVDQAHCGPTSMNSLWHIEDKIAGVLSAPASNLDLPTPRPGQLMNGCWIVTGSHLPLSHIGMILVYTLTISCLLAPMNHIVAGSSSDK